MENTFTSISTNKMVQLKQDIAALKEQLAKCEEDAMRKAIRSQIMEKETYYNILADQRRLSC